MSTTTTAYTQNTITTQDFRVKYKTEVNEA